LDLQQLPQPPAWLGVEGLYKSKTRARGLLALLVPLESDNALADDYFEPTLFMRRAHITAVNPTVIGPSGIGIDSQSRWQPSNSHICLLEICIQDFGLSVSVRRTQTNRILRDAGGLA
jgi:hypothetical protein